MHHWKAEESILSNSSTRPHILFTLLELAVFAGIVIADALGYVPFSQTPFLLVLAWISLRLRKVNWASIGFRRPDHWLRALAIGTLAGIAMELFAVYITTPLISRIFGTLPDYSDLRSIIGNPLMLLVFITLSWVMGAFGEELVFRGYLMNRIANTLGGTRAAWALSLVGTSVLFGWGHTEQGIAGWIQEGLSGALLGILYLLNGRNLTVPIVAHGVSNMVALVMIYFNRYPGL